MTRRVLVIGIGMGDPAGLTLRAVEAINRADVFFLLDKGEAASELIRLREAILTTHRREPWRTASVPSPRRDASADYRVGVLAWHEARARLFAGLIRDEIAPGGTGALLVWGDPMLYDSTLRVLEAARDHAPAFETPTFEIEVIPGITAIQALCAAHRIPLNGIGEPVEITTGRRITEATPEAPAFVALLDDGSGLRALMERGFAGHVWWGACLGTPDEVLASGPLGAVGHDILRLRAELRARKGWVMDVWMGRSG